MKILILLLAISRLVECSLVVPLLSTIPYQGVTVGFTPFSAPVNSHSQYHAQDIHGQYAYGYATGLSAKDEVKTADGVTRGGYSYIDANGILQTVQYISDPVHGFRVAATNLPRDVPAVAIARAQHLAQFEYIKAEHAAIAADRAAVISPVPAPDSYIVPVKAAAAVYVAPAPLVAISSQYQAQDTSGQYSYGYSDPNSAKSETKTSDGVTRGGYSYIDAHGVLQTVQYVSDPVNGFRVAATNLPQAPSVTLIGPKVTATVVGPKEDSVTVVQRPVDIVQNANVPEHYLQSNPNHGQVAVFPNSELPAPFHSGIPPHYADVANAQIPPQYAAGPIPVTHSQGVLYNQQPRYNVEQPVYASSPDLEISPRQYATSYPIPYPDGGSVLSDYPHPSQILREPGQEYQLAPNHGGQILVDPNSNPGHIPAQYSPEHNGNIYNPNVQVAHNHQGLVVESRGQYLADPRGHLITEDPRAYNLNADPRQHIHPADQQGQAVATDSRGHISAEDLRQYSLNADQSGRFLVNEDPRAVAPQGHFYATDSRSQIPADPRGQILVEGPRGQTVHSDPRGQISAGDIRHQQVLSEPHGQYLIEVTPQILGEHNLQHGGHRITLNPAPSADYGANYQINTDTINNGPINQQALNHEGLFQAGAQQVGVGHQAGGIQVARTPEQQGFIVRVGEHGSGDNEGHGENAKGVTAPSGYYTQNIQY